MHLAVVFNPKNTMATHTAGELLSLAASMGITIHIGRTTSEALPPGISSSSLSIHDSDQKAIMEGEITAAIGGDGTILRTAGMTRNIRRPILGINSGKLGFLANIQRQNLDHALQEVLNGNYQLDKRNFLEASLSSGTVYYALNEFVFSRRGTISLITLTAIYDGAFINRYWADGIIVSSPTGSTAYNLSTGGPIVLPQTHVMVLTPINPHTLTTRPLVLPSKKNLTIKIEPSNQEVLFSGDGKVISLPDQPLEVHIRQSEDFIELIGLTEQSYFETLRNKLMWGADVREKR